MFKKYSHKAQAALEETKDKSDVSDEDEKVQQAGRDLKTFVERVSNKSLDDVIKAAQKVCLARLSWLINRPQKTFRMTRSSRSTSEISRLSLTVSSTSPVTSLLKGRTRKRHRCTMTVSRSSPRTRHGRATQRNFKNSWRVSLMASSMTDLAISWSRF